MSAVFVHKGRLARLAGGSLAVLLAACSVAPPYERPATPMPAAFKEDGPVEGIWKEAMPADTARRGPWWTIFGDPVLDGLERQAAEANQDLEAAAARLRQARASAAQAQADRLPTVDAGVGASRQRLSPASQGLPQSADPAPYTLWRAQTTLAYEADLFGRVGATIEAARADAARSEALFHAVQLVLQADVARNYFELRAFDTEAGLLRDTIALRADAVRLVERRFGEGQIGELDVARARGELATAQADSARVARLRAASEHRLAVLLGKSPAEFVLAAAPLVPVTVKVPAGLPSALLERRPDIAAAERAMAAANARVGVARSAFFPRLELTGALGYESATLGQLFRWSSRAFVLGPLTGTALTVPLFDGGRRDARLAEARSRYDEEVAQYRQQVLVAFQEVEDGLSGLRLLDSEAEAQARALEASRRASRLSQTQYQEGQVGYLDVIDAQRQALQAQLQVSRLAGAQAVATVDLVRALGGGWEEGRKR